MRHLLAPEPRQGFPWAVCVLLAVSWLTFVISPERDEYERHPLFFHAPDLTQDPLRILPQLFITPLYNTQFDQIVLITGLLVLFAVPFELRVGWKPVVAIFWLTSAAAALLGAALLHLLYPAFPDVYTFADAGWYRTFNGGSAGSWGLMAAFATTSRRTWPWIFGFACWELFWFIGMTQDYTLFFHGFAVLAGLLCGLWLRRRGIGWSAANID